jgi:hypothetical protein
MLQFESTMWPFYYNFGYVLLAQSVIPIYFLFLHYFVSQMYLTLTKKKEVFTKKSPPQSVT